MPRYRVTIRTDAPTTKQGRLALAILKSACANEYLSEYLRVLGLPLIEVSDVTVLEDHRLESDSEISYDALQYFIEGLPGKTSLSSWDDIDRACEEGGS